MACVSNKTKLRNRYQINLIFFNLKSRCQNSSLKYKFLSESVFMTGIPLLFNL